MCLHSSITASTGRAKLLNGQSDLRRLTWDVILVCLVIALIGYVRGCGDTGLPDAICICLTMQ